MNLSEQTERNDEDMGEELKCMYNGAEDWEVNNMRDIYIKKQVQTRILANIFQRTYEKCTYIKLKHRFTNTLVLD